MSEQINTEETLLESGIMILSNGIKALMRSKGFNPSYFMSRHRKCDWSDMEPSEQEANRSALNSNAKIVSSYNVNKEVYNFEKIWIVTSANRETTTILIPSDDALYSII